jgi:hypothetical protein
MFIIYYIKLDKAKFNFNNTKYYVGQHRTNNINDKYKGSGAILKKVYRKYTDKEAEKYILAITENLDSANILEKYFIKEFRDKFGKNLLNVQAGGRYNLDFVMPEEAHQRNIDGLKSYWHDPKNKERILLRNKRLSESMKGNKNGMGHYNKHTEETKKKISERVKDSNSRRIPKLREITSKDIWVYQNGIITKKHTIKYSWKELGFTSESVCQRFTRYCTKLLTENKLSEFNYKFGKIFISYEPFDVNMISTIMK